MKNNIFTCRFTSLALLPWLMLLLCNATSSDSRHRALFPPNQCDCGAVSFDVDILWDTPIKKIGNTQQYERKTETVKVSGKSTSNSGKDTPQKIAPKKLGPTKAGDKVSIALSNFKAECPCMNGREEAGECFAYPLPEGPITTGTLNEHVKLITGLQKKIADLQEKADTVKAKIERLQTKANQPTTSAQDKARIKKEIEKLEKDLIKLEADLEKTKAQLPSGPPSVLDEKFQHGKGAWDEKGNYNAGQFDVTKPPFKYEFIIGYVCVSQACGKPTVCYKKFVVEF